MDENFKLRTRRDCLHCHRIMPEEGDLWCSLDCVVAFYSRPYASVWAAIEKEKKEEAGK